MDGISAGSFYGTKRLRAPEHVRPTGHGAILKSVRNAPSRLYREFPIQKAAFQFCDQHPGYRMRVWSIEKDNKGRRKFCVASYEAFWRVYSRAIRVGSQLHYYEVIREHYASKLYFDLEYQIEHNRNARPEEMIDALIAAIAEICKLSSLSRTEGDVIELDSTRDKKFSRHLIFQNIAFHDNVQAGDFVRRAVEMVAEKNTDLIMVKKSSGEVVPFVDLGVYTKNRCFRIVGSSKFGKTKRLLPMHGLCRGRVSVSKQLFMRSLVCTVEAKVPLLGSVSPLGTELETSRIPGKRLIGSSLEVNRVRIESPFPLIDEYVLSIIRNDGGGIYGVTMLSGSETIMYAIKGGYKYCEKIGRHHKSNNVILMADLCQGMMYQKCFDPDCRGFRSFPWPLPATLCSQAGSSADIHIDESLSDDSLCALLNRVEAEESLQNPAKEDESYDGGVDDNALNAAMDELIAKGLMPKPDSPERQLAPSFF